MEEKSETEREEMERMWRETSRDKEAIKAGVKWCIQRKEGAETVMRTWLEVVLVADEEKQKTLLYVIWELFRQLARITDKSVGKLEREFWKHFPAFLPAVRSLQLLYLVRNFVNECVSILHFDHPEFLVQTDVMCT